MRVRLVHWNAEEAEARVQALSDAGYHVDYDEADGAQVLKLLRSDPPDAVVIDLERLPSHGRETARGIRKAKALRHVPLVFAGGAPQKVAVVKTVIPDAEYASWREVKAALRRAIAAPPVDPVVPTDPLAGYSATPLPKKLGIAAGAKVALVDAPEGFEEVLGELPDDVVVRRGARGKPDVALWFVTERATLTERIDRMARLAGAERLWICWPKKASGVSTDVGEMIVRKTGLDAGLVDYKIAAIDQTWSGLLFTERKS